MRGDHSHTSWMQHSTQRDGNGLKGLLNDVSSARGPWRRGNTGVTRAMSMGSGLVQQEATHLMLGDYRLVKTLGVGAFGKVQCENFFRDLLVLYPLVRCPNDRKASLQHFAAACIFWRRVWRLSRWKSNCFFSAAPLLGTDHRKQATQPDDLPPPMHPPLIVAVSSTAMLYFTAVPALPPSNISEPNVLPSDFRLLIVPPTFCLLDQPPSH